MADVPMVIVAPVATLAVATIGTLFSLLIQSKSNEAQGWRRAYKDAVYSRRRIRRDIEEATLGSASVPPPPDNGEDSDRISRVDAMDREDRDWRPADRIVIAEDNLTDEERVWLKRERELRQYVSEGKKTPTGGNPPFQRPKPRPR